VFGLLALCETRSPRRYRSLAPYGASLNPNYRPRHRRATKQRDELAPVHVWMAPAWPELIWRAALRSLAVMFPACFMDGSLSAARFSPTPALWHL
jgi:hypothetical protein